MSDNAYVSQVVEEVVYTSPANARVSQAVEEVLYQSASKAIVSQNVIEVLRTTDLTRTLSVSITSTANIGQIYQSNLVKTVSVISTANIGQVVNAPHVDALAVTSTANVSQSITVIREKSVSVINTAFVDHLFFVNSPRVVSVTNQLFVAHTVNGVNATFYVSITHSMNATQRVYGRPGLFRVSVTSTANISSQFVRRDIIVLISVSSTANVHHRLNSEYRLSVISTANIAQTFGHLRLIALQTIDDALILTDVFSPSRQSVHILTDILTITQTFVRSGSYERDLTDVLNLRDEFKSVIVTSDSGYIYDPYPVGPGQPPRIIPPHPVVTGTPVVSAKETIIDSPGGTVILPAAEFGDTFAAKIQNNVKKSMTGKIYTYIRTQPVDKFTLTWVLGLKKALELASVIQNNNDNFNSPFNYYTLTLWNGQIWSAKVVSTTIPLTHDGRWQNSDNNNSEIEQITVSIDFEGTQLL